MEIEAKTALGKYTTVIGKGAIKRALKTASEYKRVLVVTDSSVPAQYPDFIYRGCAEAGCVTASAVIPAGESGKTLESYISVQKQMLEAGLDRHDCVIAVGGGAVGDLAGFAAATYMRGIDFINVPTTLLAQVDAATGGKTGINLEGFKNLIGAFKMPKAVFIDPDVLATLPKRHISNGLAEAVKMAALLDIRSFEFFEQCDPFAPESLERIICHAVMQKLDIVTRDAQEADLRRVLNFGHTLGHGIESVFAGTLLHGECVAIGMTLMSSDCIRPRLAAVLERCGLKVSLADALGRTPSEDELSRIVTAASHDKKTDGDMTVTVVLNNIADYSFVPMDKAKYVSMLRA